MVGSMLDFNMIILLLGIEELQGDRMMDRSLESFVFILLATFFFIHKWLMKNLEVIATGT